MTNKLEIYRCGVCGNIVQVFHSGDGALVCCGKEMELLEPKNNEEGMNEKHIPIFTNRTEHSTIIQVGSEIHPMEKEHHIEFIESVTSDNKKITVKFLEPDEKPVMEVWAQGGYTKAYEYCNVHGYWTGDRK